jgi:hypothetical protein
MVTPEAWTRSFAGLVREARWSAVGMADQRLKDIGGLRNPHAVNARPALPVRDRSGQLMKRRDVEAAEMALTTQRFAGVRHRFGPTMRTFSLGRRDGRQRHRGQGGVDFGRAAYSPSSSGRAAAHACVRYAVQAG